MGVAIQLNTAEVETRQLYCCSLPSRLVRTPIYMQEITCSFIASCLVWTQHSINMFTLIVLLIVVTAAVFFIDYVKFVLLSLNCANALSCYLCVSCVTSYKNLWLDGTLCFMLHPNKLQAKSNLGFCCNQYFFTANLTLIHIFFIQ